MFNSRGGRSAFTLIELLIVVAIIGILAAIAIPNFLNAQVRAKVARSLSDMRTLTMACTQYEVDNAVQPTDWSQYGGSDLDTWVMLTSPIDYMTSVPLQPWDNFPPGGRAGGNSRGLSGYWLHTELGIVYDYGTAPFPGFAETNTEYLILSLGPDVDFDYSYDPFNVQVHIDTLRDKVSEFIYDPSNGTISSGDLFGSNNGVWGGGVQ